jgi:peroxiredoxin
MKASLLRLAGLGFAMAATMSHADAKQRAPDWELTDLSGKMVRLSDFKGKVVVMNFWATWCQPCSKEIPWFIDLQRKYSGNGLVVVGVSLDEGGPEVVKPFAVKRGISYPVVMGTDEVAAKYGDVQAIPTTFIINREGNIAAGHEGLVDEATLESEIKPLL